MFEGKPPRVAEANPVGEQFCSSCGHYLWTSGPPVETKPATAGPVDVGPPEVEPGQARPKIRQASRLLPSNSDF